jgi:hypothetical protein
MHHSTEPVPQYMQGCNPVRAPFSSYHATREIAPLAPEDARLALLAPGRTHSIVNPQPASALNQQCCSLVPAPRTPRPCFGRQGRPCSGQQGGLGSQAPCTWEFASMQQYAWERKSIEMYLNTNVPNNWNICQQNLNTIIWYISYLKSEHQHMNMTVLEPTLYYSVICSPYT